MNYELYRDLFLKHVADGMSYREAMECFDEDELKIAVNAELSDPSAKLSHGADTKPRTLFDLTVRAQFEKRNSIDSHDGAQCLALWQAGWTSENANPASAGFWGQAQLMSLYWRAPSKRPGKPGRRFLSTNQAFNAMQRGRSSN